LLRFTAKVGLCDSNPVTTPELSAKPTTTNGGVPPDDATDLAAGFPFDTMISMPPSVMPATAFDGLGTIRRSASPPSSFIPEIVDPPSFPAATLYEDIPRAAVAPEKDRASIGLNPLGVTSTTAAESAAALIA